MGPTAATYASALAGLAIAVLARWLLDPWFGDALPFVTLFGAVAWAAWLGGYRPAILVVVLGYIAVAVLFISPRDRLGPFIPFVTIGLAAYAFTCGLIIVIGESARRALNRVAEQGELLRVTLRSIGDAVITTGNDGRISSLNDVAEALTGWSRAEAIGQKLDTVFRIINEETRQPVENPATRALREGVVLGLANHTVLIRRDGREYPIDDSAAPIRSETGTVSGCVLIFRDVSNQRGLERQRTEQLHTARLLAAIVESSNDAIVGKTLDGTIRSWNAGAERVFGYTADEAVGKNISLVIPPDRLGEEEQIIARLKAGERIEHFETERRHRDGRLLQVSLTISPIRDESGAVVGASKIARDVTERRRLEDSLRSLAADLSRADRKKNEFLAMLAHELRNPIAAISNAVRALRLGVSDADAVRSTSEMLERQVAQLGRLVEDLLDVNRITHGKIELRKARTALAPILQQAIDAAQPMCRNLGHEFTVTLPPHDIHVEGDAARLTQVVGNLLHNACKFTDPGGRIFLTVGQEGREAVIRVRDTGIGIATEHFPVLFEMFRQVDTSLERSQGGLGIGLTLVKTLVELHGGAVSVTSEGPARGSEFTVRLPVAPQPPDAAPAKAVATTSASRRVLVVDDNADGAESLAMLLQFDGHETRMAHDGRAALDAAERFRPDVILLDIGLPGMNGYEVCRQIRGSEWGGAITIVALTGWGQDEDRNRSREAGFDTHMVKPVDHEALTRLLASIPTDDNSRSEA